VSIVNLHVAVDHAWLVSDTLRFDQDGRPRSFASKCSVFPHLAACIGFRGLVALHHRVDCFLNGEVFDAEDAAELLPWHLCRWRAELQDTYPGAEITGQLWLAGWRPSAKSFGGWCLSSEDDFEAFLLPTPSTHINPNNEFAPPPAELSSPDVLWKVAEAQREMSDANRAAGGDDLGIGGEITLVLLDRSGFTVRKPYRFPDYQAIKERLREQRATSVAA
jgi:hypothetical protein